MDRLQEMNEAMMSLNVRGVNPCCKLRLSAGARAGNRPNRRPLFSLRTGLCEAVGVGEANKLLVEKNEAFLSVTWETQR